MPATPRLAVPALLASLTLLTGCAGEGGPDTASSTGAAAASSSTAASSAPTTESEPPSEPSDFPGDTEPDTSEPSQDAGLTVSALRLAAQDGFDRVVFELGGTGTPGWDVRYVEEATADGSGAPVAVAGDAVLQVRISGAGYPYDTGVEEYASPSPLTAAGTASVTEVVFTGTYEGVTSAFVGATDVRPFRAYVLEGPTRLVVELAHAG